MNPRKIIAISLLSARATDGYEIGGLVASFPPNFQNISANECGVNDMQCTPDEVEGGAHFDQKKVKSPVRQLQEQTKDFSNEHFGVIQEIGGDYEAQSNFIMNWKSYMANVVMVDPSYSSVKDSCKNQHKLCSYWALAGECEVNPGYMKVNCGPACQSCDQLDLNKRCPFDANTAKNAFEPGDVNNFFERITTDQEFAKYNVTVHSRPKKPEDVDGFVDGPWLLTLDDFVSEKEAKRLIELGGLEEYKRSTDVGALKADGSYTELTHSTRTSSNAWCLDKCMADPIAQDVVNRIEHVTLIPQTNSENLQLLRYEVGEYYRTHHDLIEHQKNRAPGVRILTFYIYLNGNEESGLEGGGTDFPRLGITVTPKLGRVAMWSSVLDRDPHRKDIRTEHAALPVTTGFKFGANAWIHQRDYITPNRKGCA